VAHGNDRVVQALAGPGREQDRFLELVAEADEDRRAARRRSAQQELVDER